jgi:hypothetical protein
VLVFGDEVPPLGIDEAQDATEGDEERVQVAAQFVVAVGARELGQGDLAEEDARLTPPP